MKERTLIFLKPDAIEKKVAGKIISRLEEAGLVIRSAKMHQITDEQYDEHYGHVKKYPFYEEMRKFITSIPVLMLIMEGEDIFEMLPGIIGATRGASPGTIRGDLGSDAYKNLIHSSDSAESASIEIARFFQ